MSNSPTLRAILKDVGETSKDDPTGRFWNLREEWPSTWDTAEGRGANTRRKERGAAVVSSGLTLVWPSSSVFEATNTSCQAPVSAFWVD